MSESRADEIWMSRNCGETLSAQRLSVGEASIKMYDYAKSLESRAGLTAEQVEALKEAESFLARNSLVDFPDSERNKLRTAFPKVFK